MPLQILGAQPAAAASAAGGGLSRVSAGYTHSIGGGFNQQTTAAIAKELLDTGNDANRCDVTRLQRIQSRVWGLESRRA